MGLFDGFFSPQQSTTSTTSNRSLPSWAAPFQQGGLQNAWNVANRPGNGAYPGTQVAPFNQDQFDAFDRVRTQAGNTGLFDSASGALQSIIGGNWGGGSPMGGSGLSMSGGFVGGGSGGVNPYIDEKNQYGQEGNPYLQQQIDASSQDMTKAWENSAMAGWMNNMARNGATQNAALTQVGGDIANDLQRNIGNMSTNVRSSDFDRRAQLEEARLGRRFQSGESGLDRSHQANMAAQSAAASMASAGASRDASMYNSRLQAALSAIGMAPQINNMGYSGADRLLGIGNQQQGNMQDMISGNIRNWQTAYNEPVNRMNQFGSQFGGFTGGSGSTQTSQPTYGPSNFQNVMGMYNMGRGMGLFG